MSQQQALKITTAGWIIKTDFSCAFASAKDGYKIARDCWPQGKFVEHSPASEEAGEFLRIYMPYNDKGDCVNYKYEPTTEDLFATDWQTVV